MCLPKVYGGLGVGNLVRRNKSLLFKWLWRFPLETDALWYAVIKSKYGLHANQWDSGINHMVTYRNPWKFVSSLYGEFHSLVAFKVGNGTKLRFWEDVWRGDVAFQIRFPSLYRLSINHNGSIAEFWSESEVNGG